MRRGGAIMLFISIEACALPTMRRGGAIMLCYMLIVSTSVLFLLFSQGWCDFGVFISIEA